MLLTDPPHEILVYPDQAATDSYGNAVRTPAGTPTRLRCLVTRPRSTITRDATERSPSNTLLVAIRDDAQLISIHSRIDYEGRMYSVDSVERFDASEATRHVEVVIRLAQ
jgi:hypothetical protein